MFLCIKTVFLVSNKLKITFLGHPMNRGSTVDQHINNANFKSKSPDKI